jgi:TRAP-type C4-dicarboxylate transport system permease small subunit
MTIRSIDMRFVLDTYYRLLLLVLAALTVFLLVPVGLQVLARFGNIVPYYMWTEEVARFCLVWIIMLGSVVAVRENTHFNIDLLPSPRTRFGALIGNLVVRLAILLFGAVFLIGGLEFAKFGMILNSEITNMNLVWLYGVFPFAAVGWILFTVEAVVNAIVNYTGGQDQAFMKSGG